MTQEWAPPKRTVITSPARTPLGAGLGELQILGPQHRLAALAGLDRIDGVGVGLAPRQRLAAHPQRRAGARQDLDRHEGGAADEAGGEAGGGRAVELLGRADLVEPAAVEQRDPRSPSSNASSCSWVTSRVVMPRPRSTPASSRRVRSRSAGSRFDSGSSSSSTRGSGARARASATRCCWPPEISETRRVAEPGEVDPGQSALDPRGDLGARQPACLEAEGDVAGDTAVREEGVVLEDHADAAPLRRQRLDPLPAEPDLAALRPLEAGEQPQQGGLAAARGPEQGEDLAGGALEGDLLEHRRRRRSAWPGP